MHPVEREQAELYGELDDGVTVLAGVAQLLELEVDVESETLIGRQLIEADRHVDAYVPAMRSVRRAAGGCGFVAGVTFAVAVLRLRERGELVSVREGDELAALAESMPECPECAERAVESRVDVVAAQGRPLGPFRSEPHPSGPYYVCPNGHLFRPARDG